MTEPDHFITDRGFKHLRSIDSVRGENTVRAFESSNSEAPYLWICIEGKAEDERQMAQLTIENAKRFAEGILWLVENHYQIQWEREEAAEERRHELIESARAQCDNLSVENERLRKRIEELEGGKCQ